MPIAAPSCRGYILASQTQKAGIPSDPYNVVPCPHPVKAPEYLSVKCDVTRKKRSCAQLVYCEIHHCGACKKAKRNATEAAGKAKNVPVSTGENGIKA